MRKNVVPVCWWLAVTLICGMIFSFSSQDASDSTDTSIGLIRTVINIFPATKDLPDDIKDDICKSLDKVVRKTAHFLIFASLGFFAIGAADSTWEKVSVLLVLLCCAFYAGTDEFHQLFVKGRAGRFTDVLIDTCGSAFGIGCYILLCKIIKGVVVCHLQKN